MTKRFLIATDPLTSDEERRLKDALGKAGWWHWLPNFWLVKDSSDSLTPKKISDVIFEINNTVRCLVYEIEPVGWHARTKKDASGRSMTEWLFKSWPDFPNQE